MSADATADARLLRLAFAVPVSALIAQALALPLAFLAPVLVLTALSGLLAAYALRQALLSVVLIGVVAMLLSVLLTPLMGNPPVYLAVIALGLFTAYRLQAHPKLAPFAAIGIPLLVLFGPLVPLAASFAAGLTTLLVLTMAAAVVAVTLAWACFPGPAQRAAPVLPPRRSDVDCAVSAAIMTLLIALTLQLDAQTALRLLMIASGVLAVPDPSLGSRAAAATFAATILGVAVVLVVRNLAFVALNPPVAALMLALLVLLIGRRLVQPETAMVATTTLVTVVVLLGAGAADTVSGILTFTAYTLGGIAIAIGLRHTLLWHLGERPQTAGG